MREFKFQKLIYDYQLDMAKFPEALYLNIIQFNKLSLNALKSSETTELLEKADSNICLSILQYLKPHIGNLQDILCNFCEYKQYYIDLFHRWLKSDSRLGFYISDVYKRKDGTHIAYDLSWLNKTRGDCSYYALRTFESPSLPEEGMHQVRLFILKVCPALKTVEPIVFEDYSGGEIKSIKAYDHWSDNEEKMNWANKDEINTFFWATMLAMDDDQAELFDYDDELGFFETQLEIAK